MVKPAQIINRLTFKARQENLGPDDIKVYPSQLPSIRNMGDTGTVSKRNNALAIPMWMRFELYKHGAPFIYNGVSTRRYTRTSFCKLVGTDLRTFQRWVNAGLLPDAFLVVQNQGEGAIVRKYWLYHQVQPFYVWYKHLMARGIRYVVKGNKLERRVLRGMQRRYEKRWLARLGEQYTDPYYSVAGKYGVVWEDDA